MFVNPTFHAVVTSTSATGVTLEFGPHYAELHGRSTRFFDWTQANKYNISIIPLDPARHQPTEKIFLRNQLLALHFAGNAEMNNRNWLKRGDDVGYVQHFKKKNSKHGERMAALWLCHCVLVRLRARARPTPLLNATDATAAVVAERLRRALRAASNVVPAWALDADNDGELSDSDSDDEGDAPLGCVGFPEGWTFGWSACRSVKAATATRTAFKKMWWLFDVSQTAQGGILFQNSDPAITSSMDMLRARLYNSWVPNTNDTLYAVAQSTLMNRAQLSGLYASIGSRCHYRLAALALVGRELDPVPNLVPLESYNNTRAPFFAPIDEPAAAASPYSYVDGVGYATKVRLAVARLS